MKNTILQNISPQYPWGEHFQYFDTLGSTNDTLKAMARQGAPEGTVLLAGSQTGGHGRLGRSFHSPAGSGIYLSLLLRPECSPCELMHLTCAAGVAVCDGIEAALGLRPGIKWTNDLVWGKRKLGGILTELGLTPQGNADYAILGIGINCAQQEADFPSDIRSIAASLSMAAQAPVDRARVAGELLTALWRISTLLYTEKASILRQYRRDCVTLGQDISILRGDQIRHAHAVDIDEEGALVVRLSQGTLETVNSGEVSIRGMYGYL